MQRKVGDPFIMFIESVDALPTLETPNLDCPVLTRRHHLSIARQDDEILDSFLMTVELLKAEPGCEVVNPQRLVPASGHDMQTVREDFHEADPLRLLDQRHHTLTGIEVPDLQGPIEARRDGMATIGMERDARDRVFVTGERSRALTTCEIPDPERQISARGDQPSPIRMERDDVDPIGMSLEHVQTSFSFEVPNLRFRAPVSADHDATPIRVELETEDGTRSGVAERRGVSQHRQRASRMQPVDLRPGRGEPPRDTTGNDSPLLRSRSELKQIDLRTSGADRAGHRFFVALEKPSPPVEPAA